MTNLMTIHPNAVAITQSEYIDLLKSKIANLERETMAFSQASTTSIHSAECLNRILNHSIPVTGERWRGDATARELIGVVCGNPSRGIPSPDAKRALARFGLRVEKNMVLVSNTNNRLSVAFRETRWEGEWRRPLADIPGASKPGKAVWIGGHVSRCVSVPLSACGLEVY